MENDLHRDPNCGPVIGLVAPWPQPNYALGWRHYNDEDVTRAPMDGIFWIAVKGEVDLRNSMPGCVPRTASLPTGPARAKEVWTIVSAPQGWFWHEADDRRCENVLNQFTGYEMCVATVAIRAGVNRDIIRQSVEAFSQLPPMFPAIVPEITNHTMTWGDCAAAKWDKPVVLTLQPLDDGREHTVMMCGIPRIVLTPTLVAVLNVCEAGQINLGSVVPLYDKNKLEFVKTGADHVV